ncbi:hypothetical protein PMKS-003876 [Pichia membranifaciens]|uniref:Uncharacterized protein n=1 Tax=Pichia membranifaciens TaxID=4926 RepID=A0A1Q2YLE6_9ASCO|nr:hypothetical protein PMKS-003876 [Pichia membranifaciens]
MENVADVSRGVGLRLHVGAGSGEVSGDSWGRNGGEAGAVELIAAGLLGAGNADAVNDRILDDLEGSDLLTQAVVAVPLADAPAHATGAAVETARAGAGGAAGRGVNDLAGSVGIGWGEDDNLAQGSGDDGPEGALVVVALAPLVALVLE